MKVEFFPRNEYHLGSMSFYAVHDWWFCNLQLTDLNMTKICHLRAVQCADNVWGQDNYNSQSAHVWFPYTGTMPETPSSCCSPIPGVSASWLHGCMAARCKRKDERWGGVRIDNIDSCGEMDDKRNEIVWAPVFLAARNLRYTHSATVLMAMVMW